MAITNQNISYNNTLTAVEAKLDTVITNTLNDYAEVAVPMCDVPAAGSPVPIFLVGHYRSNVLQSIEYRNLAGGLYTVTGTLAVCQTGSGGGGGTGIDYTTVLNSIDGHTSNTNTNVIGVQTAIGLTNSTLATIEGGISSINNKLNQSCAGAPLNVNVCNPSNADFTATNALLTTGNTNTSNINSGINVANTNLVSIQTKIDTTNTQLSAINSKLNQTCAGTPLNVFVCNQPSTTVDFGPTNTILTNILTQDTSTANSSTVIANNSTSTNLKLDTTNAHLNSIATKLNETCAGSPLNVFVCNPGGGGSTDLTATNALLTSIETHTDNTAINTAAIAFTNSKLDVVNNNLTTIFNKLNASCVGAPMNVNVCNQVSTAAMETSLASIDSQLASVVSNTSLTASNTASIAASNTTIATNTATTASNTGAIATSTASTATNTATTVTNTAGTNTRLDTANTSLNTIAGVLTQACAGTPLNVNVCNPSGGGGTDLTATNAILTSIDTKTSTVITNTGNAVTAIGGTNTRLDTANASLTSIFNKLNATCAGTPINVNICNPTSNTVMEGLLTTIDSKLASIVASNATIATNTGTTATNTAAIVTNTGSTAANTGATSTKLDTTNASLATISNVLTQTCAGTPLNVFVCNPSGGGDLTATNAILTSIDGKTTSVVTNTANAVTGITGTNTRLDTANASLTSIFNKLNATCAGTPMNMNVCNQISTAAMEASLVSIDGKMTSLVTNTGATVTNTATTATNTLNTKLSVDAVNTNITSLKTQMATANTNHVVVDNFPGGTPVTYDRNFINEFTNTNIGGSFNANTVHAISITVVRGSASITINGVTVVAPAGYSLNYEATTLLTQTISIALTQPSPSSDHVIVSTILP